MNDTNKNDTENTWTCMVCGYKCTTKDVRLVHIYSWKFRCVDYCCDGPMKEDKTSKSID